MRPRIRERDWLLIAVALFVVVAILGHSDGSFPLEDFGGPR